MKTPISAVIITYNAGRTLDQCLASIVNYIHDIVIIDADSIDNTLDIAAKYTDRVYLKPWSGYGATRNYGAQLAKHDWILTLDSDECLDALLLSSLSSLTPLRNTLYTMHRINYLGEKACRFGELAPSHKIKLYHREETQWNSAKVHEALTYDRSMNIDRLKGTIHHYAYRDIAHMRERYVHYAKLAHQPKAVSAIIAPMYHLVRSYFFKLGFLDGHQGWASSLIRASYAYKKYRVY